MPETAQFQSSQKELTEYLRDPAAGQPPQGLEQRRLDIYSRLIYNNIENFISTGFPVLRSILSDSDWHSLVRGFVSDHCSHSPYFLEIGQEFLSYLGEERGVLETDPAFILELAHYEWVELALDVSEEELRESSPGYSGDVLADAPHASPLAWSLCYSFDVHHIGKEYQPETAPEVPTYLIVYRNPEDEVKFIESNSVTARLMELMMHNHDSSGRDLLEQCARELGREDSEPVVAFGRELLEKLLGLGIIYYTVIGEEAS